MARPLGESAQQPMLLKTALKKALGKVESLQWPVKGNQCLLIGLFLGRRVYINISTMFFEYCFVGEKGKWICSCFNCNKDL